MFQSYWLQLMAASDINYMNSIENKLIGIAKGVGIGFEDNSSGLRQSQNFREQMKQKQRERRKVEDG